MTGKGAAAAAIGFSSLGAVVSTCVGAAAGTDSWLTAAGAWPCSATHASPSKGTLMAASATIPKATSTSRGR